MESAMANGMKLSACLAFGLLGGCQSWSVRDIDSLPPTAALPPTSEQGKVELRYFDNVTASSIDELTALGRFPDNPDEVSELARLEMLDNRADQYGGFVRGFIVPPSSGTYRFFISADDEAQFVFSTTASSADAQIVASVPRYSSRNQFDKYSSQASPIFNLEAGKRYYFEVIHREGYGGDHFSVAWEGPGITQSIVAGDYLYSYGESSAIYPGDELSKEGFSLGYRVGYFDGGQGLAFNPSYPPLDDDQDGLYDNWEEFYGLSASDSADATSDRDNDFLTATDEFRFGANPGSPDTDGDGIPDGVEFAYGLDPLNPGDARGDLDGDGVSNLDEYNAGTDFTDAQDVPVKEAELVPGMVGQYFSGRDLDQFFFARLDDKVEFDWGSGSPGEGIPNNVFSVRWVGYFQPPHSEGARSYTFRARRDDGVRIYLGGERIMDRWSGGSTFNYYTASRSVEAGEPVPLIIEYSEGYGGARISLEIQDSETGQRLPESSVLLTTALDAPVSEDSSGDGIPDSWALRFGLNPYEQNSTKVLNSRNVTVQQAYNEQLDPRTLEPDDEWSGGTVGSSPAPEQPPVEQAPSTSTTTVTLSWTAPGTRLDGSSISLSEIEAYEILYGQSETDLTERVEVGPAETEYTFEGLETGTWYFAVRVRDNSGLWSPNSEIVSRSVE